MISPMISLGLHHFLTLSTPWKKIRISRKEDSLFLALTFKTLFFYFLDRESIALVQKIDLEILMNLHVLRHADSKKLFFFFFANY